MNETIYKILLDQVVSWWGDKINKDILKKFVRVYIKYVTGDSETEQIIRTIKELFVKNVDNNKELAIIIGKYLIPQELEKKNNAEVSTPISLVDKMLDLLPLEFWSNEKTVIDRAIETYKKCQGTVYITKTNLNKVENLVASTTAASK